MFFSEFESSAWSSSTSPCMILVKDGAECLAQEQYKQFYETCDVNGYLQAESGHPRWLQQGSTLLEERSLGPSDP